MRAVMNEAIASQSDELMDKYFGGEEFTAEEVISALKTGFLAGDLYPVFCGVGQTGAGVTPALDTLSQILPSLADTHVFCKKGDDM